MAPRRLLPFVLAAALALRLWGITFGLPAATARPDETQIAGAALGFLSGDLRPPFFQWPMLFAYVVALAYLLVVSAGKPFGGWPSLAAFAESRRQNIGPFLLIPRVLAAVLGVVTVWCVYRLCRRLFDETVGIVAALFLAFALLHVRDSHFGVTDGPMTALVVLAVLLIVRWRDDGSLAAAAMAGLVTGLAMATKYNGALVAVVFATAWVQRVVEAPSPRASLQGAALASLAWYVAAMAIAFLALSPYILIDWSRFVADTSAVVANVREGQTAVADRGYWYYGSLILPAAIGWPMFVAGIAGVVMLLVTNFRQSAAVVVFPLVYYAVAGRGAGVFARYILPVVPFLCIAAAWLVVRLTRTVSRTWPQPMQTLATASVALAIVAPTALNSVRLDRLLARTDNRVIASREVYRVVRGTFYQSGESYGQAPPVLDGHRWPVDMVAYDAAAHRFSPSDPDWVLLQRSPLALYSTIPAGLETILHERYAIERIFPVGDEGGQRLYDVHDAFFLPLVGFDGLERPGPVFELYRKRQ